jgi:hypothetical protein
MPVRSPSIDIRCPPGQKRRKHLKEEGMRSAHKWGLAVVIAALASPATAQIISTSIPKGLEGKTDKKWAFHVMASPFAKWSINVFEETDTGLLLASSKPNSDFLIAGEAMFTASDKITVGVGGWLNKVGTSGYDFAAVDVADNFLIGGNLDIDSTVSEFHGSVFYNDFGVQLGVVRNSQQFKGASLTAAEVPIGRPLTGSLLTSFSNAFSAGIAQEETEATTDITAYAVYKHSGSGDRPWNVSLGAGVYNGVSTVPSGFVSGSVGVYKGLSLDASFWYIGEQESESGLKESLEASSSNSRLTLGIGYTF